MTEEEYLQMIAEERQRQMQSDPFARATNDYGQGAGFLGLDSQPESWDRLGEKNDIYGDLFRTTQTYLSDFVPGLYPEVEDPGQFTGYRSDVADLYRNNPAYQQLEQVMNEEGVPFEQAVQVIAANKEFAPFLPEFNGRPDPSAFRQSAEKYVSERAREGRELDTYEAERQAYEDYVNPRTEWSDRGNDQIDPMSLMRRTNFQDSPVTGAIGGVGAAGERLAAQIGGRVLPGAHPQVETAASILRGQRASVDSPLYDGRDVDPRSVGRTFAAPSPERNAGRRGRSAGGRGAQAPKRTAADRNATGAAYNKSAQAVYDFQKKKQQSNQMASKKQENQAKLVQAYNMLMYGE